MNSTCAFDPSVLQWDESSAPLWVCFRPDDPAPRGRELLPPPQELDVSQVSAVQVPCFSLRTTWLEALTLIVRGEEHGVNARFDANGKLTISRYSLLDAGLISGECKVTCTLSAEECARYKFGTPPANSNAIEPVLLMYIDALKDRTDPALRNNLLCAVGWLTARGKSEGINLPLPPPVEGQQGTAN